MAILLKGKVVADQLREDTLKRVRALKEKSVSPKLCILRVGEDPGSISYEKSAVREMTRNEIEVQKEQFPEDVTLAEMLEQLEKWNTDPSCHGILLMQPLPKHLSVTALSQAVAPEKDIDGMSTLSLGGLMQKAQIGFEPSTPQAVMELLSYYNIPVKGKDVVVVGRSTVVGLPLTLLLLNQSATVTTCHSQTKDLKTHTRSADIVISATGVVGMITAEHVKEGAVVVDVGYGVDANGALCGDVLFDEVSEKAGFLTPVPGGVGGVTSAVLSSHVVEVAENMHTKG